jgi:DNA invertase Pin-like site-specific DNA recombinase
MPAGDRGVPGLEETMLAIYTRSSTTEGLDRQRSTLRQQAIAAGWQVVAEYEDIGSGNQSLPGLERLLADAGEGNFTVVAVTFQDRLTRNPGRFREITARLEAMGIEVS